MTISALEVGM